MHSSKFYTIKVNFHCETHKTESTSAQSFTGKQKMNLARKIFTVIKSFLFTMTFSWISESPPNMMPK